MKYFDDTVYLASLTHVCLLCRRVIEMLTNDYKLSHEMRVPAISILQKVHNVGVAFRELASSGITFTGTKGNQMLYSMIVFMI